MRVKYDIIKIYSLSVVLILISIFSLNALASSNDNKTENVKLPMLWDFGAEKCHACKMMAPILKKMDSEYKDNFIVKFTDVWMPENVPLAKKYGIQSIPTQIFFNEDGKELWRHVGYLSEEDILAKLKSLGYDFSKTDNKVKVSK